MAEMGREGNSIFHAGGEFPRKNWNYQLHYHGFKKM
jgi:hypothetical protein